MKEINIAKTIISKRREKGITQEELAEYIGVSKASVSKWETGQSYPDIAFLPQLAAYFNISIDDLMGYSPQMTKEDIKKLYRKLSSDFATLKFDDVLAECEKINKKYYSCFPLVLQMAVLFINHHMLSSNPEQQKELLDKAVKMCRRVQSEGDDGWLVKEAFAMEATCYLIQGDAQNVIELLGEEIRPIASDIEMQASAFQIMGKIDKSKETLQIAMYQYLISLLSDSAQYLLLNSEDDEKFEEILKRTLSVAKIFNAHKLHPNTMIQIYMVGAQTYCQKKMYDKAIEMLNLLTDVYLNHLLPFTLHGDEYFDNIDNWFETFDLGRVAPRSEAIIKESMVAAITQNPVFACLFENPEYIEIVKKIKSF